MKKHIFFISFIIFVIAMACKPDKPISKSLTLSSNNILIGCEGNFTWGNASASIYFEDKDSVWNDAFFQINNEKLGDVLQSASILNDKVFMVMNNSNRVIVSNSKTLKKEDEISGLQSPRYIIDALNGKYYVSDLYANAISIIDQSTLEKTGSIPCIGWTEEMLCVNDKVYVCNMKSKYLYVVNTSTNSIIDSLDIGYGSGAIVVDKYQKIWITTTGNSTMSILGSLLCINISTSHPSIEKQFNFSSGSPKNLEINKDGDQLFFVNGDIYKMSTDAGSLVSESFIQADSRNIYSIGIDPLNNDIYIADAKDYVQSGVVYRYDQSGQLKSQFNAGIIPTCFLFF